MYFEDGKMKKGTVLKLPHLTDEDIINMLGGLALALVFVSLGYSMK
jgi:hypothetical protein